MTRRILVGLDGSEYASNAVRLACDAAKRHDATVIGVVVVDEPGIVSSSLGAGIGAYGFARQLRETKLSEAHAQASASLDAFEQQCRDAGIRYELASHDAVPLQGIVDEARFADVMMLGSRTFFEYGTWDRPGNTLQAIVRVGVCPVAVVPKDCDLPHRALVAFDGSVQAARALRSFVHLAAADPEKAKISLLHVAEGTHEDDQVQLVRAQVYVAAYGFDVEVINRQGRASDVVLEVAEEIGTCVVVLGAYGRRGIRKLVFGSTAERLIESERFPLYFYH